MSSTQGSPLRFERSRSTEWILLTLLSTLVFASVLTSTQTQAAEENSGFLYGRVLTDAGGEYEGFLRWGRQEAFWDDLFHSMKTSLPFRDHVDPEDIESARPDRGGRVEMWGIRIRWSADKADARRLFIARFGDISRIEVGGPGEARVEMRDGSTYEVTGYSDDVNTEIRLLDAQGTEHELRWNRIDTIEFEPAPPHLAPPAERLYGVVETRRQNWTGYVMWDKEECMTSDLLDGETRDGEVSIEMGRIRSIARRGSSRSLVKTVDGKRWKLRGTNDVNRDNRGIMVEVPDLGRITVPWDEFESFERQGAPDSGMPYDDYSQPRPLRGRVEDTDGRVHTGRMVFDLDESESWEILNGSADRVLFDIPFSNIRRLIPVGEDACRVELREGGEVLLRDGQDVSARNEGLLVFESEEGDPTYIPWLEVASITFEP